MAESRTLLSQDEIDALVSFLQDGTEVSSIGDVLDQNGIDKLIEIIQFNNNHGVFLNSDTTTNVLATKQAHITAADGSVVDYRSCILKFVITESGTAEVYCFDTSTNQEYIIYPECLSKRSYVTSGSSWGKAVSPRHFNKIANLFRIEFTAETYQAVIDRFGEVMYGDAKAPMAHVYFPTEE